MQQYSLNKMKTLGVGELLAVNGPPGTGKTTMLRDLIAHLVVARASVLAALPDWRAGLSGTVVEADVGTKTYRVPALAPALTGYEIVVASTNNGAVENLSLELPQRRHLDPDLRERLSYFGPVATKYAGSRAGKPWQLSEPVWGSSPRHSASARTAGDSATSSVSMRPRLPTNRRTRSCRARTSIFRAGRPWAR